MSILPTLRTRVRSETPENGSYIDVPTVNYAHWLAENNGRIARDTDQNKAALTGKKIAVIGAGPSGLIAAYNLQKVKCDVTVYEQADRVGGRLDTRTFANDSTVVEMGAMRFPPSEYLLNYFMVEFGYGPIAEWPDFPDPGTQNLRKVVAYQNDVQIWDAYSGTSFDPTPPVGFEKVSRGWSDFVSQGVMSSNGRWNFVTAPADITENLEAGTIESLEFARMRWQSDYLDMFGQDSFYTAFYKIFSGTTDGWRVPGNAAWTLEDFNKFGAIGVGSGGFGPLYDLSFPEFIRIVINGLETSQKFFQPGIRSFAHAARTAFHEQGGKAIRMLHPINTIQFKDGAYFLNEDEGPYDRVICATTTMSMQDNTNLTTGYDVDQDRTALLDDDVATAVESVRVINSVKVAARIQRFWSDELNNGDEKPIRNMVTDKLNWQIYTLDYGGSDGTVPTAACFITYTWEAGANKQDALGIDYERRHSGKVDKAELYRKLLDYAAATVVGNTEAEAFVSNLQPLNDDYDTNVQYVSWSSQPYQNGAFKLAKPGQDAWVQTSYYDYLKGQDAPADAKDGIFLAGDCIDWNSGWIEGGLRTGINAACGVVASLGGEVSPGKDPITDASPMDVDAELYSYFGAPDIS